MNTSLHIAVTGSAGFVANHLIEGLRSEGHTIIEADLKTGCDVVEIKNVLALPRPDVLIHLAGRTFIPDSQKDSRAFYETNIMGTLNCLDACKEWGARMVFASTYVYGYPRYLPVDETHLVQKWNPYSTSKIIGEELCEAYATHFGVPVRVLRMFNLYGPGHAEHFLIPKIVKGIQSGEVRLFTPHPKRDYVYVKDVVDAFKLCINSGWTGYEVFNVGTGRSYSVDEVVALAQEAMKTNVPVEYEGKDRPGDVMDVRADIGRIQSALGWMPKYDLADGLRDYLAPERDAHE